jgi:Mn2+/Fe2+ NRAMP family transporter
MAGTFGWKSSLELPPSRAKGFYSIIAISTLIGVAIGFLPLDPIKALFWSAVINGVISVPIMGVMMLMASSRKVMGQFVVSTRLKWWGWATAALMGLAVLGMFATMG